MYARCTDLVRLCRRVRVREREESSATASLDSSRQRQMEGALRRYCLQVPPLTPVVTVCWYSTARANELLAHQCCCCCCCCYSAMAQRNWCCGALWHSPFVACKDAHGCSVCVCVCECPRLAVQSICETLHPTNDEADRMNRRQN